MKKLLTLVRVPEGRPLTLKVLPDRLEIYEDAPSGREQMQEMFAKASSVEKMAMDIATAHDIDPALIDRSALTKLAEVGGKVAIEDVLTEEGKAVYATKPKPKPKKH